MLQRLLLIGLATVAVTAAHASETFSSLEERMTAEEFGRAGLDKLTDEELRYLNEWLQNVKAAPPAPVVVTTGQADATGQPAAPPRTAETGFRPKKAARVTIEDRIDGEFRGWSGRTRFKLKNGMVWQQVGSGEYRHQATDPKVRIEPKSLGSWKLYVEGVGRSVKVKRIK